MIERQTKTISRLLDDLLDISRISFGKIELKKKPIEISEPIKNAIEATDPLIKSQRHKLSVSLPENPIYAGREWFSFNKFEKATALIREVSV